MAEELEIFFSAALSYIGESDMHEDEKRVILEEINEIYADMERLSVVKEKNKTKTKSKKVETKEKVKTSELVNVKKHGFNADIDMKLMVKLYKRGNGAGAIAEELERVTGVSISRQTVVDRLKKIGLWGNRKKWIRSRMTVKQREYVRRHGIEL